MAHFDLQEDFLVRPALARSESARSVLDRLVATNRVPLQYFDRAGNLWESTRRILEVSDKVGWERGELLKRATCSPPSKQEQSRVSVGISILGMRCIVGQERRICPQCVADQRWTPIEWELRVNTACHLHSCLLVHRCSGCGTALAWLAHEPACRRCGQLWREMEVVSAPAWAVDLARWLNTSVSRSLRGARTDGREGVRLRLDKLLLILDVLHYEIMPQWLNGKRLAELSLPYAVQLIKQDEFRSWIWSELFLHAAKDPMTLSNALVPTGSGLAVASHFSGFMRRAPVPELVIANLEKLGEQDLLSKLSSRCRFNVHLHGVRGALHRSNQAMRKFQDYDAAEWEEEEDLPRPILSGHEVQEMLELSRPRRSRGAEYFENSCS